MPGLKKDLNYPRRMVVYAVFDVLDRLNCSYERSLPGDIKAEVAIGGNVGEFAFAVTELSQRSSILHITAIRTRSRSTEEEKTAAAQALMERIVQHIEEAREVG